jgi:predicted regulator of Ras-like GTPase activity (Roadblock/LC7/MglB family)
MKDTPIIMHEQQFQRIKSVIARLWTETAARMVLLIHRDGQPIAFHGDVTAVDTTSFSSLAAGNVAATSGMARLIGENSFPALSHEGERESIYICVVGRTLLVVVFDERSTLGLVKLRVKRASQEINTALEELNQISENNRIQETALFAEITDEDIDSLFN